MQRIWLCTFVGCLGLTWFATPASAQLLDVLVNPSTGATILHNESFTSTASIDGYTLHSGSGSLVPGNLNGFTAQGQPGWSLASPTTTNITELNLTQSSTLRVGASFNLGSVFNPAHTQDLTMQHTIPSSLNPIADSVIYTNIVQLRVLELLNSIGTPQSTAAYILNGAASTLQIKGYTVASPSGSLVGSSLHGFTSAGTPGWQVGTTSTSSISESNPSGSTAMNSNVDQTLGPIFSIGHVQDLTFSYTTSSGTSSAPVIYFTQLSGDANGDGVVNGLDISLVASNWLTSNGLTGDVNYDGVVNGLDISAVAANWLATLPSGGVGSGSDSAVVAAPEPTTGALVLIGMSVGAGVFFRQRRRASDSI